jgi:hypothetical protein
MSGNTGNVLASLLFIAIFMATVYPFMLMADGLPQASTFAPLGLNTGDCIICALIIGIVFVWSICQIFVFITDMIADALWFLCTNERIRNFVLVTGTIANNTAGRKLRLFIRDFHRAMKDKESL